MSGTESVEVPRALLERLLDRVDDLKAELNQYRTENERDKATIRQAVIAWYARRRDRLDLAGALALGYLSHLVTDGFGPYLFWPLPPGPAYTPEGGILAFFRQIELTPSVVFQLILALVVFGLWLRDGAPGLGVLRPWLPPWLSSETNPNR